MWLQISWLAWIGAGLVLNGGLQWKDCLPAIVQDALQYGKLKLSPRAGRGVLRGEVYWRSLLNVPKRYIDVL